MSSDPPIPPIDWDQRLADFIASRTNYRLMRLAARTEAHERRQAGLRKRHAQKLAYLAAKEKLDDPSDQPETTAE